MIHKLTALSFITFTAILEHTRQGMDQTCMQEPLFGSWALSPSFWILQLKLLSHFHFVPFAPPRDLWSPLSREAVTSHWWKGTSQILSGWCTSVGLLTLQMNPETNDPSIAKSEKEWVGYQICLTLFLYRPQTWKVEAREIQQKEFAKDDH